MSFLFCENNLRFSQDSQNSDDSTSDLRPVPPTSTTPSSTSPKSSLPSKEDLSHMFEFCVKLEPKTNKTTPKIPSNLVRSTLFKSSSLDLINDKEQLINYLNESEKCLIIARNDYEDNYAKFLNLTKKFYHEKLNNLKLTFKNQILKQQIYFETELIDLFKDYVKDFEQLAPNTTSRQLNNKHDKEKHVIKLFKGEMKKLIDYMRESLINSSDTLIEAFETCEILKRIDQAEACVNKQYLSLKTCLVKKHEDEEADDQNGELSDEQIEINKYKMEMEDLMNILDDIELQHLDRKNILSSRTKFLSKLKSKFKFIEHKYQNLNKKISNLKYESFVYKQVWLEKKRSQDSEFTIVDTQDNDNYIKNESSRSSSTSSLYDTDENEIENDDSSSTSNQNSTCSSSSINCNQYASDFDDDLEELDDLEHHSLSAQDYNRKLSIINNLIHLHKAKNSSKGLWYVRSEGSVVNRFGNNEITTIHSDKIEIIETNELDSDRLDYKRRQNSTLNLSECSTEGDRVIVENCSLKLDRDISEWFITRQIENMSVFKYKLPSGSVIKSGKELRIHTPFQNNQLDFLVAIKQRLMENTRNAKMCLKIRTKLISPDGIVKAVHVQEVPQFYQEIFKYASLIQFL